ncbi:hypothetical protein L9F63_022656 [Diploptera punctata]|uniref:Uncharacterized protein n=1 Tax=Diploptera punctata TaxID=6984 RepID=A0AAD7ZNH7_DIPPU|nr:hypothetical protein L9F63_022656 [Diploptera punctata]
MTNHNTNLTELTINSDCIDQINSFKYLGTILNDNNTVEEEIKTRISQGNKAYFANFDIFKSKLISKNVKFKLYTAIIRPIICYGAETWVLKEADKLRLLTFERKMTNHNTNLTELTINSDCIDQINSFKYLGTILNDNNTVEGEIKTRISQGNKAYFANFDIFKSKLISKNVKFKLYTAIIRPIICYGAETWVLKEADKLRLLTFERKMTNHNTNLTELTINSDCIDQINSFKYLGTILNDNNTVEEEIKTRISQGKSIFC